VTSERAKEIARLIVFAMDAERAADVHGKVCKMLQEDSVNTPEGVMALLGSCVIQVAKQFHLSKTDAETVLCAIMRGAEFKPS
jgi:hypothetical protein